MAYINIKLGKNNQGQLNQKQSDWNELNVNDVSFIKNKPQIPVLISDLTNDSGFITLSDIPSFNPLNYDLSDFTNTGIDRFAKLSDISSSGNTNLGYIASPTQGSVTSDTGTDATIPLADNTNAGLFSPTEKSKLAGIDDGAEVNVNADWNATSGDAQILNKPDLSQFETTSQLNTRDTNNRNRANHTGTQLASTIGDFNTAVSSNSDVTANTSARHTHSNKTLLDSYTQTEVNLADAVSKKHTHSNFASLDAVSGINTGDETNSSIITKIGFTPENSSNKGTVLGNLTSTNIFPHSKAVVDYIDSLGYWVSISASSSTPGILKLFTSTGTGTDGAMTQKAITDALNLKSDKSKILINSSAITLTATTASQKLFDTLGDNGDGSFTLDVGRYEISMYVSFSNAGTTTLGFFTGISDGTSTFSDISIFVNAVKMALTATGGGLLSRMTSFTSNPICTNSSTNTNAFAQLTGTFNVTTAGKFYPAISLTNAIAAQVVSNSYCIVKKL